MIHCQGTETQIPLPVTFVSIFAQDIFSVNVNWYFLMSKLFGHRFCKDQYIGYRPDHGAKSWELVNSYTNCKT